MLNERQKLDTLMVLGIELNRIHDLDILLERVLTRARQFVHADAGTIYIREGRRLRFAHSQNDTLQRNLPAGEKLIYSTYSLPIDATSIAGYAAATSKMLSIPDVYTLSPTKRYQFSKKFDQAAGYITRSMLTIPLMSSKKKVLGILQIINAQDQEKRIRAFSTGDEKVMLHFAGIASVALERAQMTRNMVLRMIRMAEMRDPGETGAHVNRVAEFSLDIYEAWAKHHGIDRKEIDKTRDINTHRTPLDAGRFFALQTAGGLFLGHFHSVAGRYLKKIACPDLRLLLGHGDSWIFGVLRSFLSHCFLHI